MSNYNPNDPRAALILESDGTFVKSWDETLNAFLVTMATLQAGEDLTNDVMKVEQRFSFSNVTSDTAVKSGAGFLHTVTIMPTDAAATAGSIVLYDNTAESGTIIGTIAIVAAYQVPVTLTFDCSFSTGLYVGFTTTNDVNVTVSYR